MSKKMLNKIPSFGRFITHFHLKNRHIITIGEVSKVVRKLLHSIKGERPLTRHIIAIDELTRLVRKLLHPKERQGALAYGDREFSFDESPVIRMKSCASYTLCFKMPCIPCFKPCMDFEPGDARIDEKAEHFIAKFHEEMKQQRLHEESSAI